MLFTNTPTTRERTPLIISEIEDVSRSGIILAKHCSFTTEVWYCAVGVVWTSSTLISQGLRSDTVQLGLCELVQHSLVKVWGWYCAVGVVWTSSTLISQGIEIHFQSIIFHLTYKCVLTNAWLIFNIAAVIDTIGLPQCRCKCSYQYFCSTDEIIVMLRMVTLIYL